MESSRAEHNERMPGTPQLPRRKQREMQNESGSRKRIPLVDGVNGVCDLPMILIEDRVERSPADNQRNSPISRTMQVSRIDAIVRIDFQRYRTFEKREPKFKRFDISVFVIPYFSVYSFTRVINSIPYPCPSFLSRSKSIRENPYYGRSRPNTIEIRNKPRRYTRG